MNLFRKGALTLCALLSLSFAMPALQANAVGFATGLEGIARAMSLAGGLVARGGDASVIAGATKSSDAIKTSVNDAFDAYNTIK